MNSKIIVTGSSGFIGMHLCKALLNRGFEVLGIDNMNDYYSVKLKELRLSELLNFKNFQFHKVDICDFNALENIVKMFNPNKVVNLAAQAGVRYSLSNPNAYINSNIVGFMNILEVCRHSKVQGLIYASSSSVYGSNEKHPFSIKDRVENPISIYAATKKANELMASSYSHLYGLHTTGLRFFTVYGPWGRPDMAMYIFSKKILNKEKLSVFNNGKMKRDFTYIDDIVQGVLKSIQKNYKKEVFNLGNNRSEDLMDMIGIIEKQIGIKALIDFSGMQPGDVKETYADIDYSKEKLDYNPKTSIKEGIPKFIDWFKTYYKIK